MSARAPGPRLACRWVIRIFAVAYIAALAIFLVAAAGLFGQPRDPLGGVFLIPLGLPWNLLVERAPEVLWPWLAAAAPVINILLFVGLCGLGRNRSREEETHRKDISRAEPDETG